MKLEIICVRDIKVNVYMVPMHFHHIGHAVRAFEDQCRDKNNEIGKHPEDYELYHMGEFHDDTGEFKLLERPKQISVGSNYTV